MSANSPSNIRVALFQSGSSKINFTNNQKDGSNKAIIVQVLHGLNEPHPLSELRTRLSFYDPTLICRRTTANPVGFKNVLFLKRPRCLANDLLGVFDFDSIDSNVARSMTEIPEVYVPGNNQNPSMKLTPTIN